MRTFPLLGLLGYALSFLSGASFLPLTAGFAVVGGFMLLSDPLPCHKLASSESAGATTEVSGLLTYVLGALVQRDFLWIAATLVVVSLLLLELKAWLEGLSKRFAGEEILAFTKFLLLAAVILPAVPNREFTPFQLNPYKTWLVVVAVSSVSYAGYGLQRLLKGQGDVLIGAALGGAYSSTVTTVTLAKRAKDAKRPRLYSGAILIASGMMYLRLAILLAPVQVRELLAKRLGPSYAGLGLGALAGGWAWSRRDEDGAEPPPGPPPAAPKNPLELDAAFLFAAIFVGILIVTHLAVTYLGRSGLYGLAALMGLTDIDPFIMGMTQAAATTTPVGAGRRSHRDHGGEQQRHQGRLCLLLRRPGHGPPGAAAAPRADGAGARAPAACSGRTASPPPAPTPRTRFGFFHLLEVKPGPKPPGLRAASSETREPERGGVSAFRRGASDDADLARRSLPGRRSTKPSRARGETGVLAGRLRAGTWGQARRASPEAGPAVMKMRRSTSLWPSSFWSAARASAGVAISTKAKPLERAPSRGP